MATCRKCGRAFDWHGGDGYAKLPDGSYLCSMNCELVEANEKIKKMRSVLKLVPQMLGHSSHWDATMQHGAGCPMCIRQHEILDEVNKALD